MSSLAKRPSSGSAGIARTVGIARTDRLSPGFSRGVRSWRVVGQNRLFLRAVVRQSTIHHVFARVGLPGHCKVKARFVALDRLEGSSPRRFFGAIRGRPHDVPRCALSLSPHLPSLSVQDRTSVDPMAPQNGDVPAVARISRRETCGQTFRGLQVPPAPDTPKSSRISTQGASGPFSLRRLLPRSDQAWHPSTGRLI